MIVLFEGLDKTGKTTVAEKLSADLTVPIGRFGIPPDDPADCWWYFFGNLQKMQRENRHFILDRFHLSHEVYGGRFGGAVLDHDQCWGLDQVIAQSRNSWLILMADRPHRLYDRIQEQETFGPVKALTTSELGTMQNRFFAFSQESAIAHKISYLFPDLCKEDGWTPTYEMLADRLKRSMYNEDHGLPTY